VTSPYEEPQKPELVLDTEHDDPQNCVAKLVDYIKKVTAGGA
jgi:adenylylsulfate kinase-like enzyme